jgi:hypothetical protein
MKLVRADELIPGDVIIACERSDCYGEDWEEWLNAKVLRVIPGNDHSILLIVQKANGEKTTGLLANTDNMLIKERDTI